MIVSTDKDYIETKQIMLGKAIMNPDFKLLADYIDEKFNTKVINIFYDTIDKGKRPRLNIIFEFEHEKIQFNENKEFGNYDSKKQKLISLKFRETLKDQNILKNKSLINLFIKGHSEKYKTSNLFVCYSSFQSIAILETIRFIPKKSLDTFKKKYEGDEIWLINPVFSSFTFFLHTDSQLQNLNVSKIKDWTDACYNLLKPYDEFGYFSRDTFQIHIDSKENIDNNYEGNMYYYYK